MARKSASFDTARAYPPLTRALVRLADKAGDPLAETRLRTAACLAWHYEEIERLARRLRAERSRQATLVVPVAVPVAPAPTI